MKNQTTRLRIPPEFADSKRIVVPEKLDKKPQNICEPFLGSHIFYRGSSQLTLELKNV